MLNSYEVGQKLVKGDFVSDYYFPWAKWDYAEVSDIQDGCVELTYVNVEDAVEETRVFTRGEMEGMLGWDVAAPIVETGIEVENPDDVRLSRREISDLAYSTPTKKIIGSYELLQSLVPAFVETREGRVTRLWVYADAEKCEREFHEHAGRE